MTHYQVACSCWYYSHQVKHKVEKSKSMNGRNIESERKYLKTTKHIGNPPNQATCFLNSMPASYIHPFSTLRYLYISISYIYTNQFLFKKFTNYNKKCNKSVMEGLLPLVFKAIKKNKTKRHYECISLGGTYNISMAEIQPIQHKNPISSDNFNSNGHRRYKSIDDSNFDNGLQFSQNTTGSVSPSSSKQLVRFRSHRMFSSCINGGV
jgi:hypothetical protein